MQVITQVLVSGYHKSYGPPIYLLYYNRVKCENFKGFYTK